jgi:hypothetical protein
VSGRIASIVAAIVAAGCASTRGAGDETHDVSAALDALHDAASRADGAAYFALFHQDAVFYGTDASERWDLAAFRAYAEPHFARGTGWTYRAIERHVSLAPCRTVAWFDERLSNEKYGEARGSGVLLRSGERWLVAQYNLAFPVPNELALDLVERVRALDAGR